LFSQFAFAVRNVHIKVAACLIIEMAQSVKYLLIGLLLVGATGKLANGPWLINRLLPSSKTTESPRLAANSLSPVIFGEKFYFAQQFLCLSRVTTTKSRFLIARLVISSPQFPAMVAVKSMQS
jgi:hypothetical protein